ncbi:MAG: SIS domain-containing protein [Candidatus Pacebacteria bacterium]|nr:SIS domain-containing protein [Candidatus Paceibacterota bacterium]
MDKLNNLSVLDSKEKIAELDKSNMLGSIEALSDQVRDAWEKTRHLSIEGKEKIEKVVLVGMGGSALGGDVFKHLFKETLTVPFEVYNSYTLPNYADENTLVILASYSGTTEEVINCVQQVKDRKTLVAIICAGGELAEIAKTNNYPSYIIDPVYNPSNQPRMAVGYALIGLFGVLNAAGITQIADEDIEEVINTIIRTSENLNVETKQEDNKAKLLAFACVERRPVFVGSEFLVGATHVAANQWNENAKMFADYKVVPELNHHLMEGLRFPKTNATTHFFIFFNSHLYLPSDQKRMKVTQQVVENNDIETMSINLESETKLTQVFELITLMSYAGFYVSMLEGIDPSPIPFVDYFKDELKK